uniref:Uncharacterized protein n=1 Tax=Myoviridae sp. ctCo31 TaxID=2825053 RepID=A0A8S5UMM2_9CAUD|nr:MAG TPA: hypothetical protein [Myoviridae sp. ctCo31]
MGIQKLLISQLKLIIKDLKMFHKQILLNLVLLNYRMN